MKACNNFFLKAPLIMWYFPNDKFHLDVLYVTTQKICLLFYCDFNAYFFTKTSNLRRPWLCLVARVGMVPHFFSVDCYITEVKSHTHTHSLSHTQDKSTQILTDIDFYLRTHYQWSWIWSKSPVSLVMLNHYRLVFGSKQPCLPITRTIKWTLFLSNI